MDLTSPLHILLRFSGKIESENPKQLLIMKISHKKSWLTQQTDYPSGDSLKESEI